MCPHAGAAAADWEKSDHDQGTMWRGEPARQARAGTEAAEERRAREELEQRIRRFQGKRDHALAW